MLRKVRRRMGKNKPHEAKTALDLDAISRSVATMVIGHAYDPEKGKNDIARLASTFMIIGPDKSLRFEYPASTFEFGTKDTFSKLCRFCFPLGVTYEDPSPGILSQFVFGLNNDAHLVFGICTHVCLEKEVEFLGSGTGVFCMCSMVDTPFVNLHLQYHRFLAEHLFDPATVSPCLLCDDLLDKISSDTATVFEELGLKSYSEDMEFVGVNPEAMTIAFRMSVEFYFRLSFSVSQEKTYALTDSMSLWIPRQGDLMKDLAMYSFNVLFSCLSIDNVVRVLRAVLLEEKIVFISRDIGLVTAAALSVLPLDQPLTYQNVLLPLLPGDDEFLDFLGAPSPYCFGVLENERLSELIDEDITVVYLDENKVKYPETMPHLPKPGALRKHLKKELDDLDAKAPKNPDDAEFWEQRRQRSIETTMQRSRKLKYCFLPEDCERVALIFSNYVGNFVSPVKLLGSRARDTSDTENPKVGFVKEVYMMGVPPKATAFFEQFVETQTFRHFFDLVSEKVT